MSFYIQSLFIAIPIFFILIILEWIASKKIGKKVNMSTDVISSLSSGMSNITKDSLNLGVVLISYGWLAALFAFIIQDFTGYWMHRLNHRVNVFWNRHVIHHSSEEFNLSCALRQSISETVHFSALLMIPAAFFGIPADIFSVLAPMHLFMQFWYHTRLIHKIGFLEKIIVTPSHHRVHHAINPEYIDKNYGQILIVWDKIFGSFQEELDHIKPVYGILRPAKTWNPILINFKHLWQLIQDAYYTKNIWDKFRIWFMPTGWRPEDVKLKFPIDIIQNPQEHKKYHTAISNSFITWSYIQLAVGTFFMFHLFSILHQQESTLNYFYGIFIMIHIFSFTLAMDQSRYLIFAELIKLSFSVILVYIQKFSWFGLQGNSIYLILIYSIISITFTTYFSLKDKLILEPT